VERGKDSERVVKVAFQQSREGNWIAVFINKSSGSRRVRERSRDDIENWRPFEEQHVRDRVRVGIERQRRSGGEIGCRARWRKSVRNLREGQDDAAVKINAVVDAPRFVA